MTRRDLLQRLLGLVVIAKAIPAQQVVPPAVIPYKNIYGRFPLTYNDIVMGIDRNMPRDMMLICPQSVKDAYEQLIEVGESKNAGWRPQVDAVPVEMRRANRVQTRARLEEHIAGAAVVSADGRAADVALSDDAKELLALVRRDAGHADIVVQSERVHPYGEHIAFSLANINIT